MTVCRQLLVFALLVQGLVASADESVCDQVQSQLKNGDLIFLGIPNPVMNAVSHATSSWANHLGMAFHTDEGWQVYESILASTSSRSVCRFIDRARSSKVAVLRWGEGLQPADEELLWNALQTKLGAPYDVSFNLNSRGQYCSKLVYQVYLEALNLKIGEVQSFREVYRQASKTGKRVFKFWFLRGIPWNRQTVTPRSQLEDPDLKTIWSWETR